MKKILFTLLLVATGFVAQAQNNFSLVNFTNSTGVTYALAYGNLTSDICVDSSLNPATPLVYTYTEATGIVQRDGQDLLQFPPSDRSAIAAIFDGNYYTLYGIDLSGFNVVARDAAVATYQE